MFLVAMIAPWPGLISGRDPLSAVETEKRELAAKPGFPRERKEFREFPRRVDAYLADHFGFRESLIRGHSWLLYFGLRTSPSDRVIVGRHGWLFYDGRAADDGDPIADFRGIPPLSFAELERWRWSFQNQHDWLRAHGRDHVVVLVPAKETVYPEHFPRAYTRLGPPVIEQIRRHLVERTDVPVVDLTPALIAAKEVAPVYFEGDTHWNPFGAYVGYREIVKRLGMMVPGMEPMPEEGFVREEKIGTGGDLALMMRLHDRFRQTWVFMNPVKPLQAEIEALGEGDMAELISRVDDPGLPKAGILRDSFTVFLVPYLSEHFSSAHYMWARTGFDMGLIGRTEPDVVLQIIADRAFRKGRRYPVDMERFAVRERFDRAEPGRVLGSSGGFPGLEAGPGSRLELGEDGVWVVNEQGGPSVKMPVPASVGTRLPIIRWRLEAMERIDVSMSWESSSPDTWGGYGRRATPMTVPEGTHEVTWAIVDPDSQGLLTLHLGRRPGRVSIQSLEIRLIDR